MTQSQWERLGGRPSPSFHPAGRAVAGGRTILPTHPVEHVSWAESRRLLRRHGLRLPTEAQWEYACRAGTSTPWWTGDAAASLEGAANVFDPAYVRAKGEHGRETPAPFDDGYSAHPPVDTMRPNPWGLHHVHGNVGEWCRDGWIKYDEAGPSGPDGLRCDWTETRLVRGGSYEAPVELVRSSARPAHTYEDARSELVGVRPARRILR